jgi:hypothetical protein
MFNPDPSLFRTDPDPSINKQHVNVHLKSNKQKTLEKKTYFLLASLQLPKKKQDRDPDPDPDAGSVPKCHGSTTLSIDLIRGHKALIGLSLKKNAFTTF